MKIAVTGKGGVGKSTTVGLIARGLRDAGNNVIVIDADPDMNAATILGIPHPEQITPIIELKELIAERTGTEVGKSAPFFKMNPKVDDIPEKYALKHDNITLLTMGTINLGGGGCACPENAFLKSLLSHLVLTREEWVILDMEAGIEHLGRGTALGVDVMVVVVEPSMTSIETAFRIQKLSADIGIKRVALVGNKIRLGEDRDFIRERTKGMQIAGFIDYSEEMRKIDTKKASVLTIEGKPLMQVREILDTLAK